jgi:hypothetical protein
MKARHPVFIFLPNTQKSRRGRWQDAGGLGGII